MKWSRIPGRTWRTIGEAWATPASAQAPTLAPAASAASYVLGPNDRIRLKVYGESDITGEYEIDSTGSPHLIAPGLKPAELG